MMSSKCDQTNKSVKGHYLLRFLGVVALMVLQLTPAATQELEEPVPATLDILPFERTSSSGLASGTNPGTLDFSGGRIKAAQLSLPGALAANLIPYRHVRVTSLPGGPISTENPGSAPDGDANNQDSGRPPKASDFLLRSLITAREDSLVITPTLGSRLTGRTRRLPPITVQMDKLGTDLEIFAFVIANEIAKQRNLSFKSRLIAVGCVREGPRVRPELERIVQGSTRSLLQNLASDSTIKVVRWSIIDQKTCFPPKQLADVARREKADALIIMAPAVASEGGVETVKTSVYIAEQDKRLSITDTVIARPKGTINIQGMAVQVNTLLGALLTYNGDWRSLLIPTTNENATPLVYLNLAQRQLAAGPERAALSPRLLDYLLTMAVARSGELTNLDASEANFNLARIRVAQGRVTEASALLDRATTEHQGNFNILLARAELNFENGHQNDAIAQFRDLVQRFPQKPEAYEQLASALRLQNDDDGAEQVYRDLIAQVPDAGIMAYRALAKITLTKGDWFLRSTWDESTAILQKAISQSMNETQKARLKQELGSLYADAGRAFDLKKDYPVALDFFSRSIDALPSTKAYFYRANVQATTRNQDGALFDYKQVIALAEAEHPFAVTPEYIGSRLGALELLTIENRSIDAIAWAEQTLATFRSDAEATRLEPVVLLIKLAAKLSANDATYRADVDQLQTIAESSPRRFTFGSYVWHFGTIDAFVNDSPSMQSEHKCLFRQVSQYVQSGSKAACGGNANR
jgi:tetratricopeptide (TPR) repeat protein